MVPFRAMALLIVLLLLAAVELGRWTGWWMRRHRGADVSKGLGSLQGAMLGLLALVLAFTYSFVVTRQDNRKHAVIEEANAIGTAYLRAELVPEPTRSELKKLLHSYVHTRLISAELINTPEKWQAALDRSSAVQRQLWPAAVPLARNRPPNPIDAILYQSLNEVIDMHTRRLAAGFDRLPSSVLLMVLFIAALSLGVTGFIQGAAGRYRRGATTMFVLMLAAVTVIIVDLDRPLRGMVRVSQQPLRDLARDLDAAASQRSPATGPPHLSLNRKWGTPKGVPRHLSLFAAYLQGA